MGLIFRRSVKILPGMKLNFGKKGTSVTVGSKGAHVTYGKGRKTASVGVPGTGLYYRQSVSTKEKQPVNSAYSAQKQIPQRTKAENLTWGFVFLVGGIIILLLAFMASLQAIGRILIGGIGVFTLLASFAFFNAESIDDEKNEETNKAEVKSIKLFAVVIGLIILAVFGYLFFASFDWSWQSQSKHNVYITYHYDWLKWIFYPIDLIGIAVGAFVTYIGFNTGTDNSEEHTNQSTQ